MKATTNPQSTWTQITGADYNFTQGLYYGSITVRLISNTATHGQILMYTNTFPSSTFQLYYQGKVTADGSTGYTTITGIAMGTKVVFPNGPESVSIPFTLILQPGFENGTLTLEGYVTNAACAATQIFTGPGN